MDSEKRPEVVSDNWRTVNDGSKRDLDSTTEDGHIDLVAEKMIGCNVVSLVNERCIGDFDQ